MNFDKQKNPTDKDVKFILELLNSNKLSEAKKEIDKQLLKHPNSWILYNMLGAFFAEQNQLDEALENYNKSIEINPSYAQAHNNKGIALHKLKKISDAIYCYEKALDLKKDFAEAFNNLGNAYRDFGKPKSSLEYFKKAINIKPNFPEAYLSLGAAKETLGDKEEALKNYEHAAKLKPEYFQAYNNLALLYAEFSDFHKAISCYKKAIEINPNYEKTYNNFANLLSDLGKFDEANELYYKALKVKSFYPKAQSNMLFNLNYKTDFDIEAYLSAAKKIRLNWILNKKKISIEYKYKKNPNKLKLGFVSSDFGNHPGGYFTLSTLKELKKNFDLVSYACADRKDDFSHHFKNHLFSKWRLIEKQEDEEVVKQIIDDGIHILIDMQGHSAKNRLPIFIYKPAPIQASWLAQGSTGIEEIDYFIGSKHTTPIADEKHYVERVLRLPEISQVFTPPDFDVEINSLPAIKNKFITFGCLNKFSKVNDVVINLWSKILSKVPNSKLLIKSWELSNSEFCEENLKKFKKNNVDISQLIIRGKTETRKDLLKIYNEIDISLDPFPFQGNTSTCESIWMGVPVITLKGNRYLCRFGESINSNLKMFDWIAKDENEYISKAIKFSSNLEELSIIRKNMRNKALQSSVFDAPRFAKYFSKMLWDMWQTFEKKEVKNN